MLVSVVLGAPTYAQSPPLETPPTTVFVTPEVAWADGGGYAAVLDSRDVAEFLAGHAPGAVRVRWNDFSDPNAPGHLHPDVSTLETLVSAVGVDAGRPVLVIGSWNQGWGEEGRIWWMLRYLGVSDVAILAGGWPAWRDAGMPIEAGPTAAPEATFRARVDPTVLASIDAVSRPDTVVVDTRSAPEFDGATPYGSARGGHVPGAVSLPWTSLFDDHGALRSDDEIRALVGAPLDRPVVTYCTGGVRSAFVAAALTSAGYVDVRNYAGSWWEYAATELPVE